MSEAARFIVRAELRRRFGSYVAVAVVVLISASVAMTALAGARRTASAFDRYLDDSDASDLAINVDVLDGATQAALEALPGVSSVSTYAGAMVAPIDPDTFDLAIPVLAYEGVVSVDGRFLDQDRAAVRSGRLPDPDRADEVAINRSLAVLGDYDVGDELTLAVLDPNTFEFAEDAVATVVGITVTAEEVAVSDVDDFARMIVTPAFLREHPVLVAEGANSAAYWWSGLRLEPGVDPAQVEEAWESSDAAAAGGQTNYRYRHTDTVRESVQRANRPQVVALAAFGIIAGALVLLLTGLAVRRSVRAGAADAGVLRAIGAEPRMATAGPVAASVLAVGLGAVGAAVVAALVSPLAPIGPVRVVEPDAGISFDAPVLVGGTLVIVVVGAAVAGAVARRVRQRHADSPSLAPSPPLPLVPALGVQFALGRGSAAARTAVVGAVIATVAVVATMAFGQSLRHLESTPRLFGAGFDVALQVGSGYSQFDHEALGPYLEEEAPSAVTAWAAATYGAVTIDGTVIPAIGIDGGEGEAIGPSLLSGQAPTADDEIVLGLESREALEVDEGDDVEVDGRAFTVVGTAVLPALGQATGDHPGLGTGAWLTGDGLRALSLVDGRDSGASAVLLRLADDVDDVDLDALARQMEVDAAAWGLSEDDIESGTDGVVQVLRAPRPAELVGSSGSGRASVVLGGSLFAGALTALAFALAASVRVRRRDLAVLKALGCTRRQVRGMIETQALVTMFLGAIVGVPMGIALGTALWRLFAEDVGVVEEVVVPFAYIATAGLVGTVAAVVLAAVPARTAARAPAFLALRTE